MGDLTDYTAWKYGGPPQEEMGYRQPQQEAWGKQQLVSPDWGREDHDLYANLARQGYSHDDATSQAYNQWRNRSSLSPVQTQTSQYQAPQLGYAPFTGQRYPESNTTMQANSGAAWGAMPSVVSNPDLYSSGMRQAPGYRPGIGSMTPDRQLVADNEWERKNAWRTQELDKIPAHVAWGDPRVQRVMNAQVPAGTYGGVVGPVQPLQQVPQYTPSQSADWERYQQIMADRRPWQGLR